MCILLKPQMVENTLIIDMIDVSNRLKLVDGGIYFSAMSLLEGDVESPIIGYFTEDIYKGIERYIKFKVKGVKDDIVFKVRNRIK